MFQSAPSTKVPALPATAVNMPLTGPCAAVSQDTESGGASPSVPTKQTMPVQGGGSEPVSKYYATTDKQDAIPDDQRTRLDFRSPGPQTTKSRHNQLAAQPLNRV
jgi:hypothetical protein